MKEGLTKVGLPALVRVTPTAESSLKKQMTVAEDVYEQLAAGETGIIEVIVESYLVRGNQGDEPGALVYGQSVRPPASVGMILKTC